MAKKQAEGDRERQPDRQMRLRRDLADLLTALAKRNTTSATLELRLAVIAHLSAARPPLWPPPGQEGAGGGEGAGGAGG